MGGVAAVTVTVALVEAAATVVAAAAVRRW